MVKVKVVKLDDAREPGKRRITYKAIYLLAESLNTSRYMLPGPRGYLSPSTINKWRLCPQSVYQEQILKAVPRLNGLAMIFGQANHEAMAKGFESYRDKGVFLSVKDAYEIVRQHLAESLMRVIPDPVFKESELYLNGLSREIRDIIEEGILMKTTVNVMTFDQVTAILGTLEADQLHPDHPYGEIVKGGKTMKEFLKDIGKRLDDSVRFFEQYITGEHFRELGEPEDIVAVEEDVFVVVDGIPIYLIADLITVNGVHDFKFTGAGNVERKREGIPFDIQLWLYELIYTRPAYLQVCAPPAKTAKAKPRPLCTPMGRRDKGQRVIEDEIFIDNILSIPEAIENARFEKRGQCFMGNCGACDAYEVCAVRQEEVPMLTIDRVSGLKKVSPKLDVKALKERNRKEAEAATGMSADDFIEE